MREMDADACAAIILASPLWARYGITNAEAARATLSAVFDGACSGLVAEDGGHILGFTVYAAKGTFVHSGYVRTLAVLPEAQHRGVGRRLMDAAEAEIFSQGPNVFLLVSSWNAGGQRFYEARGYRRIGEIADYVRQGITEVLYRKTVGPIQREES
jgi:ribosomal protein S18 acetylase RimI-like enzyme